jgi:hypothetical protein
MTSALALHLKDPRELYQGPLDPDFSSPGAQSPDRHGCRGTLGLRSIRTVLAARQDQRPPIRSSMPYALAFLCNAVTIVSSMPPGRCAAERRRGILAV